MSKQVSPIEHFIKKYRAAQASKSKDIRLTMDEATDIIAAFATMNTDNNNVEKKLDSLIKILSNIDMSSTNSNAGGNMDGGKF